MTIGTSAAYKNGQQFTIDVPPAEIKGRTMISARFVAGSLGATVGWNESTQTITITSTNNASASTSTPNETSQTTDSNFIAAEVTHVVDGDTMDVTYDGKKDTVRLLLVDTPRNTPSNQICRTLWSRGIPICYKHIGGKKCTAGFGWPRA